MYKRNVNMVTYFRLCYNYMLWSAFHRQSTISEIRVKPPFPDPRVNLFLVVRLSTRVFLGANILRVPGRYFPANRSRRLRCEFAFVAASLLVFPCSYWTFLVCHILKLVETRASSNANRHEQSQKILFNFRARTWKFHVCRLHGLYKLRYS